MKKSETTIGGRYVAKVSGKLTVVKLIDESQYGGWVAVNEKTGKLIRIKTAARLRYPAAIGEMARGQVIPMKKTFLEAAREAGLPNPVSHDDGVRVTKILHEKGIDHNLIGSPIWIEWIREAYPDPLDSDRIISNELYAIARER